MTGNDYFVFDTGQATDVGCKREINEDSFLSRPDYGLWVVADGMGGHAAGDVASQTIVEELNSIGVAASPEDLHARFMERLTHANTLILEHAARLDVGTIGATVAAVLVYENQFACVWSGDSRVYLLRDRRLSQMTKDHTELRALLDAGSITPEEAKSFPRKNVITHAIGVSDTPECERVLGDLQTGDVFLICSDGLTEHLLDDDIAIALDALAPQEACDAMVQETLTRGAKDNVTVVAIRCEAAPLEVEDEPLEIQELGSAPGEVAP